MFQFKAGDCFQIDFKAIRVYQDLGDPYVPVPEEILNCDLNVKASCSKRDDYGISFTIEEDAPFDPETFAYSLKGRIGSIKNPFSMQLLTINGFRYYQGCASTTPTDVAKRMDFTGNQFTTFNMKFKSGTVQEPKIETSSKVVGFSKTSNVATFSFTPETSIALVGGQVLIEAPAWYSSDFEPTYPFANTECYSN